MIHSKPILMSFAGRSTDTMVGAVTSAHNAYREWASEQPPLYLIQFDTAASITHHAESESEWGHTEYCFVLTVLCAEDKTKQ